MGPRTGLDNVEKILDPTGTRTLIPVVQPRASCYTECAKGDLYELNPLKIIVFWDVMWWCLVGRNQCFGRTCTFRLNIRLH
jgi:hypothetical protein